MPELVEEPFVPDLLPASERRERCDRRHRATPMWSRFSVLGGRRRGGRRVGEQVNIYVDQHGPVLLTVVLWLTALNFLDAWFTVLLLSHGGQEMNPLVDAMLAVGVWPFLLAKSLGVGLCGAFLTLTKNFHASRAGLAVLVIGYSALLLWHLHLTGHVGGE